MTEAAEELLARQLAELIAHPAATLQGLQPDECSNCRIALAGARRAVAAGWKPLARADELDTHLIKFADDEWAMQHPLACRPNVFTCAYSGRDVEVTDGMRGKIFRCSLADGRLIIGEEVTL